VFANIVLADEINRAPPRTQSALLEAMSERQASVDGQSHPLPEPFMVIATQNPFEFEGTYLLPESQLDRFLLRTNIGYATREFERQVLSSHRAGEPVDQLSPVVTAERIKAMQQRVREVRVDPSLVNYLLDIVEKTRTSDQLHVGVSTRGALSLYRGVQSRAFVENRDFVTPDDIKRMVVPVFAHRILPRGMLPGADRSAAEAIVEGILQSVRVPV
jgi:MoxR-like ATPase